MLDITRIRADTPGCARVTHFNNAGAALQPRPVLDTVRGHLETEGLIGGYEAADAAMDRLVGAYDSLARLVNAGPGEIAITENATRAWDTAFYGIRFRPGDRVLTSAGEYGSNALALLHAARERGIKVEVLPDDEHGQVSLDALSATLGPDVRLVAVNHIPTHDGLVNPVAEIGRLVRAAGALYLVDAVQSVGQLPVDVDAIGCDLLSATGRKFLRGPRGIGFLYVRRAVLDLIAPTFIDDRSAEWTGPESYELREDARRFESYERSAALQLGLAAAAEYAMEIGLDVIERRVSALAARLREALAEVPGVVVRDRGARRSGIVTFTREGHDSAEIVASLARKKINVRLSEQTYRYDEGATPAPRVRASVHYYNTEEEIARLVAAL
ncbi:aminotransferase class V-fold PLP-dependent enzyme [Actinomadura sp. DC4]|uniref:aminotransferase class V-fold PLP-dependent enzyme n=1 Tax=Actinomadura sp. DC4 TaxID=3055069 RepID=UPI0025B10543|nr:aminotransferase class V-fold PLP-dependent enzyme [Actinomadura sp. DC4]MDN3354585.1 aminotransferase class V-fold PLP-dependent enzyme [Actinomadura sp. DC4]